MNQFTRIVAIVLATASLQAYAQNYPVRPVRAIIAFPPGSSTDIIGRVITQKVAEYWGQAIVADNRGGAGGSIGSATVARAAPDGYTLLINSNAHSVNPSFYAKLPYDTSRDFIDIGMLAIQPNVLMVNNNSSIKSTLDLIKQAKAKPNAINIAHAGIGSGTHLNSVKFKLVAGVEFTDVAYKGSGEVIIDVMGGRVDGYFSPISAGMSFIQSGKVRAVAVSTTKRSSQLPNVPTIAESGLPGFDYYLWFGLWAPAGTPPGIVSKITQDFTRALQDTATRDKLATLGNEINIMTPAAFRKLVQSEILEYAKIVRAAGIIPQ